MEKGIQNNRIVCNVKFPLAGFGTLALKVPKIPLKVPKVTLKVPKVTEWAMAHFEDDH